MLHEFTFQKKTKIHFVSDRNIFYQVLEHVHRHVSFRTRKLTGGLRVLGETQIYSGTITSHGISPGKLLGSVKRASGPFASATDQGPRTILRTRGLFLESPENFSGPKNHL